MKTRIAVLLASAGMLAGSVTAAVISSVPAVPVAYSCAPAFPGFCLFHAPVK